ncbi:hypothetical protein [Vibrio sp. HA2012]|uniref:hypothetical protein n=1 Tax=Vibrio sp. HA2012 TaxID=1971595 RepID=UPI0018E205DE|nr:hypothetical protein [Vibrio sp. HA2012]
MAKRLCKFNRRDIADNLGIIHSLVKEPRYLCQTCARTSADKAVLCRPASIPAILPVGHADHTGDKCNKKATKIPLKKIKKAVKKQKKLEKKLGKVDKNQRKLSERQEKIEHQLMKIHQVTGIVTHKLSVKDAASLH